VTGSLWIEVLSQHDGSGKIFFQRAYQDRERPDSSGRRTDDHQIVMVECCHKGRRSLSFRMTIPARLCHLFLCLAIVDEELNYASPPPARVFRKFLLRASGWRCVHVRRCVAKESFVLRVLGLRTIKRIRAPVSRLVIGHMQKGGFNISAAAECYRIKGEVNLSTSKAL